MDPPPQEPEEAARTLEHLGLTSLLLRVRNSFSRLYYLLLVVLPVVSVWAVFKLVRSWIPAAFRHVVNEFTTTTTTNPATFSAQDIQDPDFRGLALTFLITAAGVVLGGVIGLLALLIEKGASRLRVAFKQSSDGQLGADCDEDDALDAANEQPLLSVNGEMGELVEFPQQGVHLQLLKLAASYPQEVCASHGDMQISYGALHDAAIAAQALLREGGVKDGSLVAIFLQGGPAVLVSILGIWLAGGAWLPIDREAPDARIAALLDDGKPTAIICDDATVFQHSTVSVFSINASGMGLSCENRPRNGTRSDKSNGVLNSLSTKQSSGTIAQVIYTSGSTGLPKGVIYSHRRIAFACHAFAQHCHISSGVKVLQKTPYIWAVFRHEVFPALCHRGHIVYANAASRKDPRQLAALIRQEDIGVVIATPSILDLILESAGSPLPSLRTAVCMGEALHKDVAMRTLERCGHSFALHNFYGSTETENTFFTVPALGSELWQTLTRSHIPAGHPQPCVSLYVLCPDSLAQLPAGAKGEICFGGVLSDGYWGKPELTRERFVEHPVFGRLYRTGDIGRWHARNGLQVLGRTDRQVKVRGIRVELEEVEAGLRGAVEALGGSEVAVVAAPAPGSADQLALVAFAGPSSASALEAGALRQECRARLPAYMVPNVIQVVDSLPRLPNQKVNLQALNKMAEKAEETVQAVDSLGMLRLLSRAQVDEDVWIQNQQAFWMLVVMIEHFQLNGGAPVVHGFDTGNMAWRIEMFLGHGKDMIAFIFMVGFTDSRDPIQFGARDIVLLVLALLMTGPLSYVLSPGYGVLQAVFSPPSGFPSIGHGWFLYSFAFARFVLNIFHKMQVPPGLQIAVMFAASCLFPDDVWEFMLSDSSRLWLWQEDAAFRYKGFRWSFLFMTACYLVGFYCGPSAVHWARRKAPRSRWAVTMLVGASWTGYLSMSLMNAPFPLLPFGYNSFQAVYDESVSSRLVVFHYMTHPGLSVYLRLWVCEALLFMIPPILVAVAMAYCPVHFKTMGTTSLGNYVLHPTYIGAPWLNWVQGPVLSRITSPAFGAAANIVIVLCWNVAFCTAFACTLSAWFHRSLVAMFGMIKPAIGKLRACTRKV